MCAADLILCVGRLFSVARQYAHMLEMRAVILSSKWPGHRFGISPAAEWWSAPYLAIGGVPAVVLAATPSQKRALCVNYL